MQWYPPKTPILILSVYYFQFQFNFKGSPWLRGQRHLTKNKDLKGCGFNPQQPVPAIFQPKIAKKINQAPSGREIVICCDHRLLWRDSYKGVDHALTPDESILQKIIIIIMLILWFVIIWVTALKSVLFLNALLLKEDCSKRHSFPWFWWAISCGKGFEKSSDEWLEALITF